MIKPADDKPLRGGLGGKSGPLVPPSTQIDERTPGKDLRLIGRAIRQGWAIREQVLSLLPDAMATLALDSRNDDRTRINAARVLVQMHGQNDPTPETQVNVSVDVSVGDQVEGLLSEPDYLDYLRHQAGRHPGPVRPSGN